MKRIAQEFVEKRYLIDTVVDAVADHGRGTSSGILGLNSVKARIESIIAVP